MLKHFWELELQHLDLQEEDVKMTPGLDPNNPWKMKVLNPKNIGYKP